MQLNQLLQYAAIEEIMTETNSIDKLREHSRILAMMYVLRRLIIDQEAVCEFESVYTALTNELVKAKELKIEQVKGE